MANHCWGSPSVSLREISERRLYFKARLLKYVAMGLAVVSAYYYVGIAGSLGMSAACFGFEALLTYCQIFANQ